MWKRGFPPGRLFGEVLAFAPPRGRIRAKPGTRARRKVERRVPRRRCNLGNWSILRTSATATGGTGGSPGSG